MNLQQRFQADPPEWAVVELPDSNGNPKGIFAIPILEMKKMLSENFTKWSDSDFHYQYLHRESRCYLSADLVLNLEIEEDGRMYFWSFIGTTTFEISTFESENEYDNNDNFTATANSLCIVNAASKIGRQFGMFLNPKRDIDAMPISEAKKKSKPSVKKTINLIIKKQN